MKRVFVISFLLSFCFLLVGENPNKEIKVVAELPSTWLVLEDLYPQLDPILPIASELFEQKIKIKSQKIGTTLNMRPTFWSLVFKKRDRRTYVLRINNNENFQGVLFYEIPFDAQVGLLAHELMHIEDYLNRSFFGVLQRGWQYLSRRGRIKFETEIDQMVIESGFGYYLLQWSDYVLHHSSVSERYKQYKREVYLTPIEIAEEVRNLESSANEDS